MPGRPRDRTMIVPLAGNVTPNPLYKEVKSRITRELATGVWKPGDSIPSESRLARDFAVSIGTVRKAIDELVAEKILLRQQGRGTFVATHSEDRTLFFFFHIVGKDGSRELPVTDLLSFRRAKAGSEEGLRLGIAPGSRVLRIRNLLKLSGKPVIFDEIVVPEALFPGLDEPAFAHRDGTIYGLYQARFGISVIRISERLSAAQPAQEVARLLEIGSRTPVLVTDRCSDRYRQHDESCCAVATRNGEYDPGLPHPARARYLEWLSGYVARERLEAPGLGAALERNLTVYRHPRWYRALARLERLARRPIRISVKIAKRTTPKRLRRWVRGCFREGYLVVSLTWLLAAMYAALPYLFSDDPQLSRPVDALFEGMSGFSTTGASVVVSPETMDRSLQGRPTGPGAAPGGDGSGAPVKAVRSRARPPDREPGRARRPWSWNARACGGGSASCARRRTGSAPGPRR